MTAQRQPLVNGATRLIGIVGDPVAQVRSPEPATNSRLTELGANALLVPLHVPADRFETAMPALLQFGNLAGIVFTVPFKQRALAFANEIRPAGVEAGAINAMRREG